MTTFANVENELTLSLSASVDISQIIIVPKKPGPVTVNFVRTPSASTLVEDTAVPTSVVMKNSTLEDISNPVPVSPGANNAERPAASTPVIKKEDILEDISNTMLVLLSASNTPPSTSKKRSSAHPSVAFDDDFNPVFRPLCYSLAIHKWRCLRRTQDSIDDTHTT
ncbi:hypothetical protein EW146_g9400 [Bondarzewia mesenterica]|uniref:Uncharacterized protein n=1 Tax=Bondarzewia mesenterica TaxID=1095465 RepID=A0A4S4L6M5_9AGAM|nr:hypothetical protein EW146_g9400 [Bondarzewia mesenterica]